MKPKNPKIDGTITDFYMRRLLSCLPLAAPRHHPSDAHFERLSGHLPEILFDYWREVGFGAFGDGLFWLVDPIEYAPVARAWGEACGADGDGFRVVARSAFGKLFVWDESITSIVKISAPDQTVYRSDARTTPDPDKADVRLSIFIGNQRPENLDFEDTDETGLFERALKTLGPLEEHEMYGFEPALGLGGLPMLENLRKVRAVEHLILLAQLDEVEVVTLDIAQHVA